MIQQRIDRGTLELCKSQYRNPWFLVAKKDKEWEETEASEAAPDSTSQTEQARRYGQDIPRPTRQTLQQVRIPVIADFDRNQYERFSEEEGEDDE
jgi:hypothetical protein